MSNLSLYKTLKSTGKLSEMIKAGMIPYKIEFYHSIYIDYISMRRKIMNKTDIYINLSIKHGCSESTVRNAIRYFKS